MPLIFYTDNLNQKQYTRLCYMILYKLYNHDYKKVMQFLNTVKIEIYPLSKTVEHFFDHIKTTSGQKINTKQPSGVAGKFNVKLFLHDKKLSSLGFKFRENADRIGHEFGHEKLWLDYGTTSGHWVEAIHDRDNREGKFTFWYWTLKPFIRLPITIIDSRNL